ncbi:hypothetical protein GCM10010532_113940 [Dactylosporangium siamense]|uniref:Uncharacterized protein n=1 Tax=Dactylosporangium siamense TaxID=685454 RepID=A0A919Q3I5_9ACTN|nr:hypothetical protein Dsi01nite_112510 [Dactylosporangium siamense]
MTRRNLLWCNEKTQNPGMKVVLSQINFTWGSAPTMSVTYTATLPVRDETMDFLAGLLTAERARRGTLNGWTFLKVLAGWSLTTSNGAPEPPVRPTGSGVHRAERSKSCSTMRSTDS